MRIGRTELSCPRVGEHQWEGERPRELSLQACNVDVNTQ